MNLNDLKETKDFDESYISHEQRVMGEYLVGQGFETFIEGPYKYPCHNKEYCYIWAVKIGGRGGMKKIDGRGYDVYVQV